MRHNTETQGELFRDQGISKALYSANRLHTDWTERAYLYLKFYIQTHREFMTEELREASYGIIPLPPSARAWGGVVLRAAKDGLIYNAGYRKVKNEKAHCTPATLWKVR